MEVADSFMPTGGAVGLLPMVTYFFLVVATFAFVGLFIVSLSSLASNLFNSNRSTNPFSLLLFPIVAAVAGISYYVVQSYYHSVLAELVTVTDGNDRQTLIRESFNALSQYRYMALFIVAPVLMLQLLSLVPAQRTNSRMVGWLTGGSAFLFFLEFLGQQSLSFDNEVQTGSLLLWGVLALAQLGSILFIIYRLRLEIRDENRPHFQVVALSLTVAWSIYLLSYLLTLTPIDRNYLQLALTLADLGSILSVGRAIYMAHMHR